MERSIEPDQAYTVILRIARQELLALRVSVFDLQRTIETGERTIEASIRLLEAVSESCPGAVRRPAEIDAFIEAMRDTAPLAIKPEPDYGVSALLPPDKSV